MTKVEQMPPFKPSTPQSTMIICTTDNKPLPPEDIKALEEYIEFRKKRAKKEQTNE